MTVVVVEITAGEVVTSLCIVVSRCVSDDHNTAVVFIADFSCCDHFMHEGTVYQLR